MDIIDEEHISSRIICNKRWKFRCEEKHLPSKILLNEKALYILNITLKWNSLHIRQLEEEKAIRPDLMSSYEEPKDIEFGDSIFGMQLSATLEEGWYLQ